MKNHPCRRLAAERNRFLKAMAFSLFLFTASASLYAQNCTINAGIDQTICANGTMTLSGTTSGLYQGGGAASTTWTRISGGAVTIASPSLLNTSVTGFSAGAYTFRLSTTCADGSAIYDDAVITVSPVVISNAGADQLLCPGSGALTGNAPSPGTGYWAFIGTNNAGVVVASTNSPTSAITLRPDSAGATTLRYTITQGSCSSSDDVIITNRGGVPPVNAGPDQALAGCYSSTTSATMAGSFAGKNIGGQGGLWTTVSGPNTPVITTPSSLSSTVTNLVQGIYVFRWTASGACLNGFDDVQINVPAPSATLTAANAGGAQTYCDGRTTVVLSGNTPAYAGEAVQWTQTAGPAGATITSPAAPSTTITGLNGTSTYVFQYTITNTGSGCSSASSIPVDYNTTPAITVNGGVKAMTLSCGTTFAAVPFTFTGGNTTQCRILSAPAGYTPSAFWTTVTTSPQYFYGINKPGTYVIRFMRTGGTGCPAAYDDVNVIVSTTPSLSRAGTYQILACNVVSTSLAGNIPGAGTGSWSEVSGPNAATIVNPASNTSAISGLVNGQYVFKWIISAGPACPASEDTVSVLVSSTAPTVANAGPDRTVCSGSPVMLAANSFGLNETGAWTVTPSTGISFSNAASPTAIVNGMQPNTAYTFTWTISNACGTSSDNVVITANNTTGPVQATAGADQCLPLGTTATSLSGNSVSPLGASSAWSQASGPSSAAIANPSGSNSSITGLANGTYQFVRTMSLSGCASTVDTVLVTVSAPATMANAGTDQSVCASTATLSANNPAIGTGAWTQVSGPGGPSINSSLQNNSTISGLVPGVYNFRWAVSNGGCAGTYDDVVINVSTMPSASNAGPDQNCLSTASTSLAATAATTGIGLWSQVSGPAPATITTTLATNTTVTGLANGVYTFRWTITAGAACVANTDDVVVSVNGAATSGGNVSLCNVTTTLLSGNTSSNGAWTQINGPNTATLTTLSGYTASAENLVPGSYIFRYALMPATGCAASYADKTVTLTAPPSTAVAGANQSVCNTSSFSFAATSPTTGTGTWTKVTGPASGSFSNPNLAGATFTGAATGLYTFLWTVSNGGCGNAAQMTINNAAPASVADAGIDQTFCGPTVTNLAAASPASGTGSWTKISGPATASIANPALASTQVSAMSNGNYTFRWTVSSGACVATIDDVRIGVCSVLPLHILSFEGEKKSGYARLQWKTVNEEAVKSFVVERGSDGNNYMAATEVSGKNGALNAYEYNDNLNGLSVSAVYYRLKMVNADGNFSYSKVVRINLQKISTAVVAIAPNPVQGTVALRIESNSSGKASIQILDGAGKLLVSLAKMLAEGTNNFLLEETRRLPNGLYVVQVQTSEGTYNQLFIVQR